MMISASEPRRRSFHLVPRSLSDPAVWAPSITREGIWVLAIGESEARDSAMQATVIAFLDDARPPPHRGSPWLAADLATCEPAECPFALTPGVVFDERGWPIVDLL